jgi:ATP-dependent protease ClpP protease subunit
MERREAMKYRKYSNISLLWSVPILAIILALIVSLAILPSMLWAEPRASAEVSADEEAEDDGVARCPYTTMTDQDLCLRCHGLGRDFKKIKETNPHDMYDYPTNLKIYEDEKGKYGYYDFDHGVTDTSPFFVDRAFRYLKRHNINRMIIELDSPGGSVFAGWKTVAVIRGWQAKGFDVTTQVNALAASAAFVIFCAADKRLISPTAELMGHELWTFTFFSVDTPADSEHKAKVLKHIQDTITTWLANRAEMDRDVLAEKLKKKEYWMNGVQAKHFNWATGYTIPIDPETEKILLEDVEQF